MYKYGSDDLIFLNVDKIYDICLRIIYFYCSCYYNPNSYYYGYHPLNVTDVIRFYPYRKEDELQNTKPSETVQRDFTEERVL